jgi:hypothetical protein
VVGYYATMFSSGFLSGAAVGGLQSWWKGGDVEDILYDTLESGLVGGAFGLGFGAIFRASAAAWPKVSVRLQALQQDYWKLSGGITVDEAKAITNAQGFQFEIGRTSRFEDARGVVIGRADLQGGLVNRIILAEEIQHGLDGGLAGAKKAIAQGFTNEQWHAQVYQRIIDNHAAGSFQFLTPDDLNALRGLVDILR